MQILPEHKKAGVCLAGDFYTDDTKQKMMIIGSIGPDYGIEIDIFQGGKPQYCWTKSLKYLRLTCPGSTDVQELGIDPKAHIHLAIRDLDKSILAQSKSCPRCLVRNGSSPVK
jgi:hypothetical protein